MTILADMTESARDRLRMHGDCTPADLVDHYSFDPVEVDKHGKRAISAALQERANAWAKRPLTFTNERG